VTIVMKLFRRNTKTYSYYFTVEIEYDDVDKGRKLIDYRLDMDGIPRSVQSSTHFLCDRLTRKYPDIISIKVLSVHLNNSSFYSFMPSDGIVYTTELGSVFKDNL